MKIFLNCAKNIVMDASMLALLSPMSRITKRDLRTDSALVVTNDKKILV